MVDVVTRANEKQYREAFCVAEHHTMECVEDTVTDMGKLLAHVCHTHLKDRVIPIDGLLEQMGVEVFQQHLTKLLSIKSCTCNKDKDL